MRSVLQGRGIPAYVPDEYMVQADWLAIPALGGIRITVPASYAETARAVLREHSEVSDKEVSS